MIRFAVVGAPVERFVQLEDFYDQLDRWGVDQVLYTQVDRTIPLVHAVTGASCQLCVLANDLPDTADPTVILIGDCAVPTWSVVDNIHTVHVSRYGGARIELRLDPDTGAVTEFTHTSRVYKR